MRAVVDKPSQPRVVYEDIDGNAESAPADIEISVTDGDGDEVATGTATDAGNGVYTFNLGPQAVLDRLTARWTTTDWAAETTIDVVGGRLVEISALKAIGELSGVAAPALRDLADEVEEGFTHILGFPPALEGKRLDLIAPAGPRLLLPGVLFPREIYACTQDGDVVDPADLEIGSGAWIEWADGRSWIGETTVTLHIAHGLIDATPDLRTAARILVRYLSREPDKKIPERATRVITEGADLLLSQPDEANPTGLPDVDRVLVRRRQRVPV